jgi:hypothetical protein
LKKNSKKEIMKNLISDTMKNGKIKAAISIIILLINSCNEPETIVTNFVHPDGSVTRKIEMKSIEQKAEDRFKTSDLQVPFDTTWIVRDSCEISDNGDTTWVRRAVKLFKNVDEINLTYKEDSGANRMISRRAGFKKRFRWFSTEFYFSETFDKKMSFGYPVKDFLNDEELLYFYSPDNLRNEKETGTDSIKYKALSDTIRKKVDLWTMKNLVSEWIGEFSNLTKGKAGGDMAKESLKAREDEFVELIIKSENKFDSLWTSGIILMDYLGKESYQKFRQDADTALETVTENLFVDFKEYTEKIVMPGKVIGTNGFIDSVGVMLWPVKSDFFMTEKYEIWAESRVPNRWSWIISVLFLIFVISGIVFRKIKRG